MSRWCVMTLVVILLALGGDAMAATSSALQPAVESLLAEALPLVEGGRFPEALPVLRRLNTPGMRSQLPPEWQRRVLFLLALADMHRGEFGPAALHLERARQLYPELQDYVLRNLGDSLCQLQRWPSARTAYQWLLEAFPDSLQRPEALFRLAEVSTRLGDLKGAADLLSRYQREYPEGAQRGEVWLRLGLLQRDLGSPAAALHTWRTLWVEHPEDPAAEQVPGLEKALPGTFVVPAPTADELGRRAQQFYRVHRYREAAEAFKQVQAANAQQPLAPEMLYQLGMAQYQARDNAAAAQTFRQLDAAAPTAPLAPLSLLMQARLALRVEDDAAFLQAAQVLAARFPQSQQADEVGYLLGHFYRNRGQVDAAMRAFQRVTTRGKASEYADDAWWYLGWMHYEARAYGQAAQVWEKLHKTMPASALTPDTLYWQGRALEQAGRTSEARVRYERLRSSYQQTFYGYLAAARLAGRRPWLWKAQQALEGIPAVDTSPLLDGRLPTDRTNPHAVRGQELWAMRLFMQAGDELEAAAAQAPAGAIWQARAAQALHRAGEHARAMRLLRQLGGATVAQILGISGLDVQHMTYPLGALQRLPHSDFHDLDPLLIGALIMAESNWNPHALSRVGARGLMQLMPETGRRVAERLGLAVSADDQLFEPALNLRLGVAYLAELSQHFEGRLPLILASYNAGEELVNKWWAQRQWADIEEFIANIPFRETRRYVQRVYVYYAEYQRVYRPPPG